MYFTQVCHSHCLHVHSLCSLSLGDIIWVVCPSLAYTDVAAINNLIQISLCEQVHVYDSFPGGEFLGQKTAMFVILTGAVELPFIRIIPGYAPE